MLDPRGAETAHELSEPGSENRRHVRHSVAWPAICFAEGGERFEALIINVSEGGFGLTGPGLTLGIDSILYVDFDQIGAFRCCVAWSHDNRFGVEIIDDQTTDATGQAFNLAEVLRSAKQKCLSAREDSDLRL